MIALLAPLAFDLGVQNIPRHPVQTIGKVDNKI